MIPKGKMFCQYCVNSPNSKNENPSSRKGSNKYFLIAKETQDKRYTLHFSLVFIIIIKKSESCITMFFNVLITCLWPDDGWQTGLVELPSGLVDATHY